MNSSRHKNALAPDYGSSRDPKVFMAKVNICWYHWRFNDELTKCATSYVCQFESRCVSLKVLKDTDRECLTKIQKTAAEKNKEVTTPQHKLGEIAELVWC